MIDDGGDDIVTHLVDMNPLDLLAHVCLGILHDEFAYSRSVAKITVFEHAAEGTGDTVIVFTGNFPFWFF